VKTSLPSKRKASDCRFPDEVIETCGVQSYSPRPAVYRWPATSKRVARHRKGTLKGGHRTASRIVERVSRKGTLKGGHRTAASEFERRAPRSEPLLGAPRLAGALVRFASNVGSSTRTLTREVIACSRSLNQLRCRRGLTRLPGGLTDPDVFAFAPGFSFCSHSMPSLRRSQ
jgi:hypothetical protein